MTWTDDTREFLRRKEVKYFIGGAIAACAAKKIAETETVHKLAVNTTAALLGTKDSIEETIENIKEDAEDIHQEAKEKTKVKIYEEEEKDSEDEE